MQCAHPLLHHVPKPAFAMQAFVPMPGPVQRELRLRARFVRLSAGSRLRHVMEGIPRGEAESPKAMLWQGCGCVFRMDVCIDRDGIPSERLGSVGAKRQTDASGAEGDLPARIRRGG